MGNGAGAVLSGTVALFFFLTASPPPLKGCLALKDALFAQFCFACVPKALRSLQAKQGLQPNGSLSPFPGRPPSRESSGGFLCIFWKEKANNTNSHKSKDCSPISQPCLVLPLTRQKPIDKVKGKRLFVYRRTSPDIVSPPLSSLQEAVH